MSDEIILNDDENNIIEYVEITNSGLGTLDSAGDMIIISEHDSSIPVIRPPYISEDIANKKNNLSSPNSTDYPTTFAVYNAINNALTGYTGTTGTTGDYVLNATFTAHTENNGIHYVQSAITINENQVVNLINDLESKSNTGHTHSYIDGSITDLPNLFTGNTFTGSGNTTIIQYGDNIIIYTPAVNAMEKVTAQENNLLVASGNGGLKDTGINYLSLYF